MTLYAMGDIQGCAGPFEQLLERLEFDPGRDHLWLVGDLVNRGPESATVLRRVRSLGDSATCVLGNHDLHLLALAAGARPLSGSDTFRDVLNASDADELLEWLRFRPLLHWDEARAMLLVHAGIPPRWSVRKAQKQAHKVERLLRGPGWREFLQDMYGNAPLDWSEAVNPKLKRRYTVNALTRMRFCRADGSLDLEHNGPPGSQPGSLLPWFEVPGRRSVDTHIVFGHWSALGFVQGRKLTALDTGCIWGGSLTAIALDPPGDATCIDCGARGTC